MTDQNQPNTPYQPRYGSLQQPQQPQPPRQYGQPQPYGQAPQSHPPMQGYQPQQGYQPGPNQYAPTPGSYSPSGKRQKRPAFIAIGAALILAAIAAIVFGVWGIMQMFDEEGRTPINEPTQIAVAAEDSVMLWVPEFQPVKCTVVDAEGEQPAFTYPNQSHSSSAGAFEAALEWEGPGEFTVDCDAPGAYVAPSSSVGLLVGAIFALIGSILGLVFGLLFLIPGLKGDKFQWSQSVSYSRRFGNN